MSSPSASENSLALLRANIDRSVRWPVLLFFTSAGFWFLASIVLGMISTWALLSPDTFSSCAMLQYGRVQSAHTTALVYGFGFNLAFGLILWLMHRLCRLPMKAPAVPFIAGHIWNIAITVGILFILGGVNSGLEWLEFPKQVGPALLISYIVIALWAFVPFTQRDQPQTYVSLWFIVAALFAFPALYLPTQIMVHIVPGAAVISAAINHWYIGGLLFLFFAPVAVASVFYFVPKVSGRPLFSFSLAVFAFWALIFLGGWTGLQRLMGGPLPAWMTAISGAATFLLIIPALLIWINARATLAERSRLVTYSATLRFSYAASIGLVIATVFGGLTTIPSVFALTGLTQGALSVQMAILLGVFMFAGFGAIYFIIPRLCGCEWRSGSAIRFHFWFTTYAVIMLLAMYLVGGFWQGEATYQLEGTWKVVTDSVRPYYIGRMLGWVLLLIANFSFVINLWAMIFGRGRKAGSATLLHEVDELDKDLFVTESAKTSKA